MQVPLSRKHRDKLAAHFACKPVAVSQSPLANSLHWLNASHLSASATSAERTWLFDQESLTRRLTNLSHHRFSVRPLQQGWAVLRDDECLALNVPIDSQGLVREVYLLGSDEPWVFARSVAARSALEGSGLDLATLGSRSLGELLFSDNAFSRGELQACRYPAQWLPTAIRDEQLWARRSCFRREQLAVLVAEVFLPSFWPHTGSHL